MDNGITGIKFKKIIKTTSDKYQTKFKSYFGTVDAVMEFVCHPTPLLK